MTFCCEIIKTWSSGARTVNTYVWSLTSMSAKPRSPTAVPAGWFSETTRGDAGSLSCGSLFASVTVIVSVAVVSRVGGESQHIGSDASSLAQQNAESCTCTVTVNGLLSSRSVVMTFPSSGFAMAYTTPSAATLNTPASDCESREYTRPVPSGASTSVAETEPIASGSNSSGRARTLIVMSLNTGLSLTFRSWHQMSRDEGRPPASVTVTTMRRRGLVSKSRTGVPVALTAIWPEVPSMTNASLPTSSSGVVMLYVRVSPTSSSSLGTGRPTRAPSTAFSRTETECSNTRGGSFTFCTEMMISASSVSSPSPLSVTRMRTL
mmetsp:Transcript_45379/g.108486  ORF Transcript_45379/g.108486 Transcript_45379/m.108486 type:complete len:321 (+) Transcript_45379:7734-8696(+)